MPAPIYSQINSNRNRTAFLMLIFLVFIFILGWFFGKSTGYGYEGLAIAIVFSLFMSGISYFGGDKVALWSSGARPIEKKDQPEIYRIIENLAITAGMPTPKIYINQDPGINAFATGRDPKHAS
ncbi:MAG: M48 family metalloprotease, partial [Patescibacteria group bacterium]